MTKEDIEKTKEVEPPKPTKETPVANPAEAAAVDEAIAETMEERDPDKLEFSDKESFIQWIEENSTELPDKYDGDSLTTINKGLDRNNEPVGFAGFVGFEKDGKRSQCYFKNIKIKGISGGNNLSRYGLIKAMIELGYDCGTNSRMV